jgi:hypothetical protein
LVIPDEAERFGLFKSKLEDDDIDRNIVIVGYGKTVKGAWEPRSLVETPR